MAMFRRPKKAASPSSADLSVLVLEGEDLLERTTAVHRDWGLGTAEQWGLDQTTGLITWTFPDRTAMAPAQILASYSSAAGTWVWACENPSILQRGILGRPSRGQPVQLDVDVTAAAEGTPSLPDK